ncbi:ABC transporter ATP-binding protein [bacterium]|nr:ABC transporter ATP-binding protein [bacterium]
MPDNPPGPVAALEQVTVTVPNKGHPKNILTEVSFSIEPGTIYALLGRNGAGKTTAIHVLLGLLNPTSGQSFAFGRASSELGRDAFRRIGYMPEGHPMDPAFSIRHAARLHRPLYPSWDDAFFSDCLKSFSLREDARPAQLSRGERALAALALCVSARPDFLILDDPTLGLDQIARNLVFGVVLRELADRGCSILLTTHDIFSVAKLADRVGVLRDGSVILDEPLSDILGAVRKYVIPFPARAADIPRIPGVLRAIQSENEWRVVAYCDRAERRLMEYPGVSVHKMNLEELFIAMVEPG